jgi:CRP-like cAMP-binding protein
VHVDSNGNDMNVALLREGEYFGERSLLTGDPCSASISALTDMSVVLLPIEEFQDYIKNKEGLKYLLDVESIDRQEVLDQMRSLPDSKQEVDNVLGQIKDFLNPHP